MAGRVLEQVVDQQAQAVLPGPRPVLFRETREERPLEQPALECSWPQHEFAYDRPKPIAKPPIHRNREAHLPSCQDFAGYEIPQRGPQRSLRVPTMQLVAPGDCRDVLDELVVQKRHPTLDRCGHAHLILLHQELDQVRLDIRVAHPLQRAAGGLLVGAQSLGVRVPRTQEIRIGQQLGLEGHGKNGPVIEEQVPRTGPDRQERPRRVATQRPRESAHEPLHRSLKSSRGQGPIGSPEPLVPGRHPIALVTEEELIGPLAGEHDLDVVPRQARDEVERDARGKPDRLVFMPEELGQRAEELRGGDHHLAVLRPDRAGRKTRVRELVRLTVGKTNGEGTDRLLDHRCHEGRQPARIDPARQEQPERHVAHEVAPDRLRQTGTHVASAVLERPRCTVVGRHRHPPVATLPRSVGA